MGFVPSECAPSWRVRSEGGFGRADAAVPPPMPLLGARDSSRPGEEGDVQPEEEKVEPSVLAGKTPRLLPSVPPRATCLLLDSNSVPRKASTKMEGAEGGELRPMYLCVYRHQAWCVILASTTLYQS